MAADTLVDVMQTARKPSDKTTAATAVLDRIGIGAKSSVEISGQIAVKAYVNVSPDDWDDEPATDGAPADAVGGSDETQQA